MPLVARGDGVDIVDTVHPICIAPGNITTDTCSLDVFTVNIGTHRKTDLNEPHTHCPPVYGTPIVTHSPDVFANNLEVARWGDTYDCGAKIIDVTQSTVFANEPGEVIDGVFVSDNPYQQIWARQILIEAGSNAPHDDPDDEVKPYLRQEEPAGDTAAPVDPEPAKVDEGTPVVCGDYKTDPIDYNQKLSANYTIKDLSAGAVFAHTIVAQNGLSVADIICNLKAVAENILEPLRVQYPGLRVNSGFRRGTSNSQHNRGMAVDIQWPGLAAADYTPRAEWVRDNLPIDQLIFEHGNSIWLHISYNRTAAKQRGQLLTYSPKTTPNYKPGLANYYA